MHQFVLKVILKIAAISPIKLIKKISSIIIIQKFSKIVVRNPLKKKISLVVAYIRPSQYAHPGKGTSGLRVTKFQIKFVELKKEQDVMHAVVEARKSNKIIVVLRNDAATAKEALTRILNELSRGCYVNTEFDDLRTIVDSADIMSSSNCVILPNVVIGSGTARGDNAGIRALEIAIVNTELEEAIRSKKVNGIFLIISMSQSYKKLSIQTGIKSALRKKIGFESFTLYDTNTDDTLGDAVEVTLLAAI
jgi:hypothetical protein